MNSDGIEALQRVASWFRVLGILVVSLGFSTYPSQESFGQKFASWIPSNTIFYIESPSLEELRVAWKKTHLAQVASQPLIWKTMVELSAGVPVGVGGEWSDFSPSSLSTIAMSTVSYSIQLKQDGTPVYVLMFESHRNHEGVKEWIRQSEKKLIARGWMPLKSSGYPNAINLRKGSKDQEPMELAIRELGQNICIVSDISVANSLADCFQKDAFSNSLAEQKMFRFGLESVPWPGKEHIIVFANPIELAQVYQSDPDDGIDPRVIAIHHGFDAIQGIVGKLTIANQEFDISYKLAIFVPQPLQKSMKMLDFQNRPQLVIPPSFPDYLHSVHLLNLPTEALLESLLGPLDELTDSPEGTFQQILDDLKGSDGPGIDLQKDLFEHFHSDVFTLSENNRPANRTSERNILCVRLKDSPKVAATLRSLLKNDPNVSPLRIPGQPFELWKIGTQNKKGNSFSSPGLLVSGDFLFLASNVDAIRKLIAAQASRSQRMIDANDVTESLGKLDLYAGKEGFFRMFVRIEQDAWTTYELLRQGTVNDSESLYAQLLTRLIDLAKRKQASIPRFADLPSFESFSRFLGRSAVHARVIENGWEVSGFIMQQPSPSTP